MKIELTHIEDSEKPGHTTRIAGSVYHPDGGFMTVSPRALQLALQKSYDADVAVFDKHGDEARWIDGEFTAIILR
jgi:hypothetical protein